MRDDARHLQYLVEMVSGDASKGNPNIQYGTQTSKHSYGQHSKFGTGMPSSEFAANLNPGHVVAIDEEEVVTGTVEASDIIRFIDSELEATSSLEAQYILASVKKEIERMVKLS